MARRRRPCGVRWWGGWRARWASRIALIGFAIGCAGNRANVAPIDSSLASLPTPLPARPFAPGRAEPARRAKLDAVAPKLDAFFAAKMKESGATGFAVGVIVDGEPAYLRGFGVRDLASATPVDADTVFRLASLTKSFTALAVLKLRDEGKLALDDPATKYLPELARAVAPSRDAPPISLRMLLTNASGLGYDDLWGAVTFGKTAAELDALLGAGVQLSSTPGTLYAYSNLGWALLGRVVERVSRQRYRDYVTDNILRPLGMTSAVWEPEAVPPAHLAIGYRPGDGETGGARVPEPTTFEKSFAPAGGLYASLRDYARYAAYQIAAYPPRDDPESGPVRRSTLREMHEGQRWVRGDKNTPVVRRTDDGLWLGAASYGFGWLNVASCTEVRVQHGGFEPGYYGWSVLVPRARVAYVGLATSGHAAMAARSGVLDILRDAGLLAPIEPVAHPALAEAGTALAGLLDAWSPSVADRVFDPQSVQYSWNAGLHERFAQIGRDHGPCRPEGKLQVYGPLHGEVRLACERGAVAFDMFLSPATPPRLQHAGIREEIDPDERTARAARRIAASIRDGAGETDADLFAPSVDQSRTRLILRRLAIEHGTCEVGKGWIEVSHGLNGPERNVRYALSCTGGPLELSFAIDRESGRVASFDAHAPRTFDATCWP